MLQIYKIGFLAVALFSCGADLVQSREDSTGSAFGNAQESMPIPFKGGDLESTLTSQSWRCKIAGCFGNYVGNGVEALYCCFATVMQVLSDNDRVRVLAQLETYVRDTPSLGGLNLTSIFEKLRLSNVLTKHEQGRFASFLLYYDCMMAIKQKEADIRSGAWRNGVKGADILQEFHIGMRSYNLSQPPLKEQDLWGKVEEILIRSLREISCKVTVDCPYIPEDFHDLFDSKSKKYLDICSHSLQKILYHALFLTDFHTTCIPNSDVRGGFHPNMCYGGSKGVFGMYLFASLQLQNYVLSQTGPLEQTEDTERMISNRQPFVCLSLQNSRYKVVSCTPPQAPV